MENAIQADTALSRLVAVLADNKHFLGRRYAEWCTAAPTLESAVAAASMAQDEIGHARSLYPMLADLAPNSRESEPETRTQFVNVPFLDHAFEEWTDFVAVNFIFDTALTVLIEGARDSSISALSQRARRMLEEERLHWLHGEGWVRRLSREGGQVRRHLQDSIGRVLPDSVSLFSAAESTLVLTKVVTATDEQLHQRFRQRVGSILIEAELEEL